MKGDGFTLGDLMIAIAAVELLVVVGVIGRSHPGARPDATAEAVSARRIVVGAGIAAAIGLALMGLFWPLAQEMRIL